MAYVTINTTVDVDLSDIDTDSLLEELQSRNAVSAAGDLGGRRHAMLKALWDRDENLAIELLKTYLCDCLGRATV